MCVCVYIYIYNCITLLYSRNNTTLEINYTSNFFFKAKNPRVILDFCFSLTTYIYTIKNPAGFT